MRDPCKWTRVTRERDSGAEIDYDPTSAAPYKKIRRAFSLIVLEVVSGRATTEAGGMIRGVGRRDAPQPDLRVPCGLAKEGVRRKVNSSCRSDRFSSFWTW